MKIINNILFILALAPNLAFASHEYKTSCSVNDGNLSANLETESVGLKLYGNLIVKTFDKHDNAVGTLQSYQRTNISSHSIKTILQDKVQWYVTRCELDLDQLEVTQDYPTTTVQSHVVVQSRPTTIIHHSPRVVRHRHVSPSVSVGINLPIREIFPRSHIRVHHHEKTYHHKRRHHHKKHRVKRHKKHRKHHSKLIVY